jgi:hypothetical protein
MTFSQKVALAFTIAGFILLIPGTFGLFVVAMFLFQPSIATIGFFLTILMIYLAGGALLRLFESLSFQIYSHFEHLALGLHYYL